VSTLDELFSGRKELFDGLYIYDKWDWTKQYPVIWLDFGGLAFETPIELEQSLAAFVQSTANKYNISLPEAPYKFQFKELIEKLHDSTGQQVVILIDEYDKPIIDHLSDIETMEANIKILHAFYPVLKAADRWIKFIFITGVSKFSGLSVFSSLNNPSDITLNLKYNSICGYTQEELETYFAEYIDELAAFKNMTRDQLMENIKRWYNGYSWDGKTSVYNPFSTLQLFENSKFANYWFKTGTPTFLMEMLKRRNNIEPILKPIEADASAFDSYNPVDIGEVSLLFQTGYLTIKGVETMETQEELYTLDIPNAEVRDSFTKHLLHAYSDYPLEKIHELTRNMHRQINACDSAGFDANLRLLIANVPNILHKDSEAYYHSIFLVAMKLLGFEIQGELMTNIGRIDAVLQQPKVTVIVEIKYAADKTLDKLLEEAMKQIYDNKYYEAYADRKVMLMAVAFTGKEVKCEMKMYDF
jgi:hypothetical protein